ncbi:MAG: bifunctional DNA-formamidopyrimidine glycosylase/DNA-(apurinic or apyrimidinic site) lyase [Candidatus Moranbacteria bacterium]|nr:bifunctional DNA-formamidopyrimidine glycosylase/DNA-(apurinic or apyrimidinic site) lyase [Candidatus Moranbacteria bacterium]
MPELPEVQTIVNQLKRKIINKQISKVWSDHRPMVKIPSWHKFNTNIKKTTIESVQRRGKNIFLALNKKQKNYCLWIHLKMTGHLIYVGNAISKKQQKALNKDPYNRYLHFIFYFTDQTKLLFSDLRKFGRLKLFFFPCQKIIQDLKAYNLDQLGPEPLNPDFDVTRFKQALKQKSQSQKSIKEILLDQKIIAGIGNIYASEILYLSGINPGKKITALRSVDYEKIFQAMRKVLTKAIECRGTSSSDFRDAFGYPGDYAKHLKVYSKVGQKCDKCGTIIKRIKQGNRSTFFCPKCQT